MNVQPTPFSGGKNRRPELKELSRGAERETGVNQARLAPVWSWTRTLRQGAARHIPPTCFTSTETAPRHPLGCWVSHSITHHGGGVAWQPTTTLANLKTGYDSEVDGCKLAAMQTLLVHGGGPELYFNYSICTCRRATRRTCTTTPV
jgi:hypothetical protein